MHIYIYTYMCVYIYIYICIGRRSGDRGRSREERGTAGIQNYMSDAMRN